MGKIGLATDHGGFVLKEEVKAYLEKKGVEVVDYGTYSTDSVDYPDYGKKLAQAILEGDVERGIAFCGTGIGISIALNRHKGIRAALCHSEFEARVCRQHNDANVLVMGGRTTGVEIAYAMVDDYLATDFEGGRHERRVCKIDD